jgi:hypothetical protein
MTQYSVSCRQIEEARVSSAHQLLAGNVVVSVRLSGAHVLLRFRCLQGRRRFLLFEFSELVALHKVVHRLHE